MSLMMQQARAPYRASRSQGDPGLFDWARKGLGYAAKTALGLTGFGGAAGAISSALSRREPAPQFAGRQRQDFMGPIQQPAKRPPQQVMVPRPGVVARVQRFLPGGATGTMSVPVSSVFGPNGNGLACGSGFRPNKTSYFLRDGTFIEEGSRCVKRRQRNPMNPRALSRAIGRIDAGKRFQNRMSEISTGKFTAAGKKKRCP